MKIFDYPAWKNGTFCQIKDLTVNIFDFGLLHADAVYDTLSSKNRKILLLDDHLDRFENSTAYWRFISPIDREELKSIIFKLCKDSNTDDLLIWFCITRGTPMNGNIRDLAVAKPNMFIYVKPYFNFTKADSVTLCISTTIRIPDQSINQRHKNFAWGDLNMAQLEASDRKFESALLLDYQGNITEGPGFGIFFADHDTIYTPEKNCLGSITILALERICKELGIKFIKDDIKVNDLKRFTSACVASTAGNFTTVSKIEDIEYHDNDLIKRIKDSMAEKLNDDSWTVTY